MAQTARRTTDPGDDWTVKAADRIELVVETVRDKTTVPVQKVARGVVYGLVAAVMALLAFVLSVIGLFRLHRYLPFQPEARRVWVTYMGLGAIFLLAGMFSWRKRRSPKRG
jgi:hypothetical protein